MHQVSAAEANFDALRAAQAQWNLEQTSKSAPMDALVFDTYYNSGAFAPSRQAGGGAIAAGKCARPGVSA